MKGKFIVIYGINNIGKSTQARLLVQALREKGMKAEHLKYPIYDLEPTGPRLDRILRQGAEIGIPEIELQKIYAQNRKDYEPELLRMLTGGTWVVAEDYTGTGLSWGWTKGVDLANLEEMNKDLLQEDCAILLDGRRFMSGKEHNHIHEQNDTLIQACRQKHLALAQRYAWHIVDAAEKKEEVAENIWQHLVDAFDIS